MVQQACNALRMESAFPFIEAGAVHSASEASLADITNRLCHFEHAQTMLGALCAGTLSVALSVFLIIILCQTKSIVIQIVQQRLVSLIFDE